MNHLLWNMLTQLQSGQKAKKKSILHKKNKLCGKFLDILWAEGYILNYRNSPFKHTMFQVFLKYHKEKPAINKITAVSKPNLRLYLSSEELWKLNNGLGLVILSTSKGIISSKESKKFNIGGEVFCIIK
jgi:small subunit ribosomal protein S8